MTNNIDVVRAETAYRAERVRNDIQGHAIRRSAKHYRKAGRKHLLPDGGLRLVLSPEEVMADLVWPVINTWTATNQERTAA